MLKLLSSLAVLLSPAVHAAPAYPPVAPGVSFDAVLALPVGQPAERLSYGASPQQFAELWLPAGDTAAPVVVFIHGGCWLNAFGIDHSRPLATALAQAGYAVLSLEYRRLGDPGGGWPGSLDDVRASLALLDEAVPGRLDRQRVVLAGHSAGGHLALLLGSEIAARPQPGFRLRGVLGLAPIVDLETYAAGSGSCNRAGARFIDGLAPEQRLAANPAYHPAHPGTIILLGQDDAIVPYQLPTVHPHRLVGEPAGHFDWIHPGSPAWSRALGELERLVK